MTLRDYWNTNKGIDIDVYDEEIDTGVCFCLDYKPDLVFEDDYEAVIYLLMGAEVTHIYGDYLVANFYKFFEDHKDLLKKYEKKYGMPMIGFDENDDENLVDRWVLAVEHIVAGNYSYDDYHTFVPLFKKFENVKVKVKKNDTEH